VGVVVTGFGSCFLAVDAGDNVDFASVSKLAVGIINKLDHCQRGIGNTENTVAQFERSLKTAKAGAVIEAVPPPRPTTQAPPVHAPIAEARKAAVNFSARDLALLKQKKADETDRVSETSSVGPVRMAPLSYPSAASVGNGYGASQSAAVAASASPQQQQVEDRGDQLPPDWVEKFDKKSNRAYYVNQ
jgi:hypothetical protein